jgi:hypothetical protein
MSLAAFAIAGGLVAFGEGDAEAFCRSRTCRSTADHECVTDADECPAEGAELFWPTSCVGYAMNRLGTQELDPDETRAVIRKAFQAWTDVPCGPNGKDGVASMTFQERDPVACKKSEYNKEGPNLNVVLFQDDDWNFRSTDRTIAKTSVTYNDETGEIYDADIEVNTANNIATISDVPGKIEYDLQAVLTHEVGHFIGIAHSMNGSAVMAPSYSPGETQQRKLSPDDIDAVCTVYPPNSGVACNVEPRGGFSATCDGEDAAKGLCSVAAVGSSAPRSGHGETPDGAPAASFAFLGLGVLAAARLSRRPNYLGRRS